MIKLVSWWHVNRVAHFLVETDAAIGDNKHTNEASRMSLIKVDPINGTKEKHIDFILTLKEEELGKVLPRSYH